MNPILKKIAQPADLAFTVMDVCEPRFYPEWHFHPEYELIFILEGTGSKYLGNKITRFGPGDLTLIGPNIPHLYKCDEEFQVTGVKVRAVVIYFLIEQIGTLFLKIPEAAKIKEMLDLARLGINFRSEIVQRISLTLAELPGTKGFDKIITFLNLIHILSESDEFDLIDDLGIAAKINDSDERINKLYNYVVSHFQSEISLHNAADLVHMNVNAFCRYFKKRTNLTFIEFLTDIRVNYACRLLTESNLPVKEICYESGFNSISTFLNLYKKKMGLTPQQYREIQRTKTSLIAKTPC
jgi:AraC-like DNA-binding protein